MLNIHRCLNINIRHFPGHFVSNPMSLFSAGNIINNLGKMRTLLVLLCLSVLHVSLGQVENVDPEKIRFLLYNKTEEPEDFQELKYNNISTLAGFDPSLPTVLIADGLMSTYQTRMSQQVKDVHLTYATTPQNVIVLDYRNYTGFDWMGDYAYVVLVNVPKVAIRVADMLHFLHGGDPNANIHIIGHSLGGPLASSIGFTYKLRHRKTITRVTALDPARPYYEDVPLLQPKRGDAAFVEVYHTDKGGYGLLGDVKGDMNVFVNGGGPQPFPQDPHEVSWKGWLEMYKRNYTGCPCEGNACYCMYGCPTNCGNNGVLVGVNTELSVHGDVHLVMEAPPGIGN